MYRTKLGILAFCSIAFLFSAADALGEWFSIRHAEESVERRQFRISTVDIDLGSPRLNIAAPPPKEFQESIAPGRPLPLLLVPSAPASSEEAIHPFVHNGEWLSSPEGFYSAVGWTRGHQPLFFSTYLADDAPLLNAEIICQDQTAIPIALNRSVPGHATLFTSELFSSVLPKDDEAFWALLIPQRKSYLLQMVGSSEKPFMLRPGYRVLMGTDEIAALLHEKIRRGQRVNLTISPSCGWEQVQESFGRLGMPLVWDGEAVTRDHLAPELQELWKTDVAALPLIVYFPRQNRLQFIWSRSKMQPYSSITRRTMIQRLIAEGASHAIELGDDAPPLLPGEMELTRFRLQMHRTQANSFLFISESTENDPINLCRLPGVKCFATAGGSKPSACIDGRWSEATFPDSIWQGSGGRPSVEIDLGRHCLVQSISILNAENAGFSPQFNTSGLIVTGRKSSSSSWETIREIKDNVDAQILVELPKPKPLQYVRIEIISPSTYSRDSTARLAEVQVWGKSLE